MSTYLQLNRDSFIEMSEAGPNATPGFTHIHMPVYDPQGLRLELNELIRSLTKKAMDAWK